MFSRARTPGIGVLSAAALSVLLSGCEAAAGESAASSLRPAPVTELPRAAAPDSAKPARPRRQIVSGVEVVVNIPSGRLELMEGDSVVRSYPVSVGSARYATPVGDYLLATVIWNPWWRPPPESEWARNRKPEPPGPGNPMGRVKLHMDELIYIHGTTSEGRLGAPASHGCIRMSNADVVDLAKRLHRYAAPDISDARLEAMSAPGRQERHTVMARSIRMRVTYRVAQVRGDRLHVFPDVYGRVPGGGYTAQVKAALAGAGADTAQLPPVAFTALRSRAVRGGASFAFAEIPTLQPLPPEPRRQPGPRVLGTPVPLAPAPPPAEPSLPDFLPPPLPDPPADTADAGP